MTRIREEEEEYVFAVTRNSHLMWLPWYYCHLQSCSQGIIRGLNCHQICEPYLPFNSRMRLLRHSARDCTSSAERSRSRSPSNSGHDSTMWLIVCRSPHWHLSDDVVCHLWRLAAQRPCTVPKRFNTDHVERPRLKPGSRIVGSDMRFLLASETELNWLSGTKEWRPRLW